MSDVDNFFNTVGAWSQTLGECFENIQPNQTLKRMFLKLCNFTFPP